MRHFESFLNNVEQGFEVCKAESSLTLDWSVQIQRFMSEVSKLHVLKGASNNMCVRT